MTFKRKVLTALGKDELLAAARGVGLEVTTRMTVDDLREALAGSKRAKLGLIVTEELSRDTLKEICRACGLDDTGKEKRGLVARILTAGGHGEPSGEETAQGAGSQGGGAGGYAVPDTSGQVSQAAEGSVGVLPGLATWKPEPAPKGRRGGAVRSEDDRAAQDDESEVASKGKGKGKAKGAARRRAGVPESEAVVSGSLKAALRQFALAAAGGYRGRDGALSFTTHLLECFGWPGGRPEGVAIPHTVRVADAGQLTDRPVALWWPERRTLLDVVAHDAVLDFAWRDTLRVCLQMDPPPQYVVFTNQRDLQLYDLARDREAARLSIPIDDLPKYSEAFPFFTTTWVPGMTPRIVNVEKVSTEVADLVAKLYRSVRAQYPDRQQDVIRFTLQCITAMFAEDIGLLPKHYFTSLLYEGARAKDLDARLHALFVAMNTPDLPAPRVVPYFNGGLFTDAVSLSLGSAQVVALTKAAEANWTYVDPHIFGSVFQGIMDDDERHASGAHYTAHDDIMRVVGPTIVEPWRKRIQEATTLKELADLRAELFRFRVLDPACGSGNFLYVAFRELYKLDTELLSRMREFRSMHGKLSWNGGIPATNFYGIDINPFAVELAKVTLNIAKKIAYEERRASAYALAGQVEIDLDPSLPLDNLDENIVCMDALFSEWPEVDAIVGNPPFLGGQKIRKELGLEYQRKLQGVAGVDGLVDLVCYFFRKAHDHLGEHSRAGFIATSGIRVGKAREASLDYVVQKNGTIVNAVSSKEWPGEAALTVSIVNWTKSQVAGPHTLVVGDEVLQVERIPSHLQPHADASLAKELAANSGGTAMGVIFGHEAFRSTFPGFSLSRRSEPAVRPMSSGDGLLRGLLGQHPDYCIYFPGDESEEQARRTSPGAFAYLDSSVRQWISERAGSGKETDHYATWLRRWWRPQQSRWDFLAELHRRRRYIACSKVMARPIFEFISRAFVPNDTLQVFSFDDDWSFGILQSALHWTWMIAKGGKVSDRIRYTNEVWSTLPWPQQATAAQVEAVCLASVRLREDRRRLMRENGWSLRALYQASDIDGSHPLKTAHAALDAAVRDAYGAPADQDPLEFLIELNQLLAEDEAAGKKIQGPGLPDHLDPKDPRWYSTDCIEPPPAA